MNNRDILQEKAVQLCDYCSAVGLPRPQCKIVNEYAVNFTWLNEGRKHVLSLYYKSKEQHWTPVLPKTDWWRRSIYPQLQPFFEQARVSFPLGVTSPATNTALSQNHTLQAYFVEALDCLSQLKPFAHENINFSIICQLAKEALRMILHQERFSSPDRAALAAALEIPCSSSFSDAKEYLSQCLALCHINS